MKTTGLVPLTMLLSEGLVGLAVAGGLGCSRSVEQPPADKAAEIESTRCGADVSESALAPVLSGKSVEGVEPLHASWANVGPSAEVTGAVIKVRATPGVTAEWLERALECHSARRVLGRIPSSVDRDDPFWLPGRTVDIVVKSGGDSFRIGVRGASAGDAQEILGRANTFAKRTAVTAPMPK